MRQATIGALAFLAVATASRTASAESFVAGDVLRVTFDLTSGLAFGPPAVTTPDGTQYLIPQQADIFGVSVFVNSGSGVNTFTTRLFDGEQLLGTSTVSAAPVLSSPYGEFAAFFFVSATSPWQDPVRGPDGRLFTPVVIDFNSILDGSINGIVEFTMDAGRIDRRKRFGVELFLGRTEATGVRVWPEGESPVPEPASLLLVGAGLSGLGLRRLRRL